MTKDEVVNAIRDNLKDELKLNACQEPYCMFNTSDALCLRCLRNKLADITGVVEANRVYKQLKK